MLDKAPYKHPSGLVLPITGWTLVEELITPERAKQLLASGIEENRTLRKAAVHRYALSMAEKNWPVTPEMISVAPTGRLLNGHHRMAAIIEYGEPVRMLVAYGVPESVYAALDRGVPRSVADALGLSSDLTAAVNLLLRINGSHMETTEDLVRRMAELLADDFSDLLYKAKSTKAVYTSAKFKAAALIRMYEATPESRVYTRDVYRNYAAGAVDMLPKAAQLFVGYVPSDEWKALARQHTTHATAMVWRTFDPDPNAKYRKPTKAGLEHSADEMRKITAAMLKKARS